MKPFHVFHMCNMPHDNLSFCVMYGALFPEINNPRSTKVNFRFIDWCKHHLFTSPLQQHNNLLKINIQSRSSLYAEYASCVGPPCSQRCFNFSFVFEFGQRLWKHEWFAFLHLFSHLFHTKWFKILPILQCYYFAALLAQFFFSLENENLQVVLFICFVGSHNQKNTTAF